MVKINLKTATPINISSESVEVSESKKEVVKEKTMEVVDEVNSIESDKEPISPEEITGPDEQNQAESSEIKSEPIEAKPFATEEEGPIFDTYEDDTTYYAPKSKKKYLFISLIVVILGAIIYGGMQFAKSFNIFDFFKKTKTAQAPPPETQPPPGTVSQKHLGLYQKNLGSNKFLNDKLQKVVTARSGGIRYSLIVLTPSEINLTVLADSKEKISTFKSNLQKSIPDLTIRTISTKSKFINRAELVFADLNSKISVSSLPPFSGAMTGLNESPEFENQIQNLTKQQNIKLEYLKQGRIIEDKAYRVSSYYLNLNGNRGKVLNLMSTLTSQFPLLQVNKISINPTNYVTYSDNQLSVRLNISYYRPKN
jgi:hypothetical protein